MAQGLRIGLAVMSVGLAAPAGATSILADGVMDGAINGAIRGALIGAVAGGLFGLFAYLKKKNGKGPKDPAPPQA